MPRLSIIIPYRHDDQRLEATLLSVLENRPQDCEVIVVHDGRYSDPYRLGDEVVFVDADATSNCVELLNAGCLAACSPVVNTLLDGVIVSDNWAEEALNDLAVDEELAAVAMPIHRPDMGKRGQTALGLDLAAITVLARIRSGRFVRTSATSACAGPELACGFFRRSVLLALDGFSAEADVSAAALDFACALRAMGLSADCVEDACVLQSQVTVHSQAEVRQAARLAVQEGLASAGIVTALKELLAMGFVRPHAALAWSTGVLKTVSPSQRYHAASEQLAVRRTQGTSDRWLPERRAA